MKVLEILKVVSILALAVLATGCISFRGGQLTKQDATERPQSPVAEKVILVLKLCCDGKPSEDKSAIDSYEEFALKAVGKSGLFGDIHMGVPGAAVKPGEFVLKYEINNWGHAVGIPITLFIIPCFCTDHYTVRAEVLDSEGRSRWREKYEDKMTTVFWIGFFPGVVVPPCYPIRVYNSVMNNIYQHSFKDILENKVFSSTNTTARDAGPPANQRDSP